MERAGVATRSRISAFYTPASGAATRAQGSQPAAAAAAKRALRAKVLQRITASLPRADAGA